MRPAFYCRADDLTFCRKHKDQCFGGGRCKVEPYPADAPDTDVFCSVCCGVLKPREARS